MKPTIYVSNWASAKTPGHHGPGRKLTIMAAPRAWEHGDGKVGALTPRLGDLQDVKARRITGERYRHLFQLHLDAMGELALPPGKLTLVKPDGDRFPVLDGDTVCCACSKADAAAGRCHRVWSAHALAAQGWRVILDGEELVVVPSTEPTAEELRLALRFANYEHPDGGGLGGITPVTMPDDPREQRQLVERWLKWSCASTDPAVFERAQRRLAELGEL